MHPLVKLKLKAELGSPWTVVSGLEDGVSGSLIAVSALADGLQHGLEDGVSGRPLAVSVLADGLQHGLENGVSGRPIAVSALADGLQHSPRARLFVCLADWPLAALQQFLCHQQIWCLWFPLFLNLPVNSLTHRSRVLGAPVASKTLLVFFVDFCPREQRLKAWKSRTAGLASYFS